MKKPKNTISKETQTEAMNVAKSTQKQGQSKDQTKLIAQGIEKGIALYKKQQKEKARQADKEKKKQSKQKQQTVIDVPTEDNNTEQTTTPSNTLLPWALLGLSWIGFIAYQFI